MKANLKPFDLLAALNGEPVMLRNDSKAFVRHHETEVVVVEGWQLWGVVIGNSSSMVTWTKSGGYNMDGDESGLDIIGMFPKTRIINGFEVPAPETEEPKEGNSYFYPEIFSEEFYDEDRWSNDFYCDKLSLKRGLVFLTKEDAIANAKAMLGIDPYGEASEE